MNREKKTTSHSPVYLNNTQKVRIPHLSNLDIKGNMIRNNSSKRILNNPKHLIDNNRYNLDPI